MAENTRYPLSKKRRTNLLTTAVRLYGAMDLRTESFMLPEIKENEVLIKVVTDTLCTSTYKAVKQGSAHKRVPDGIDKAPVIIGHEMCGEIVQVGSDLSGKWRVGQKIVIQPALKLESGYDPGYSYRFIGGSSKYCVVPSIVLERGCMIPYCGEGFFEGSLVEALGCILRGYKGFYHTDYTDYKRSDGAKKGGRIAILGGAGPMGLGAVELAMGYAGAGQITVTDIDEKRLEFARRKCPELKAKKLGCRLDYVNTKDMKDPVNKLKALSDGGYDDVFVMVPVPELFSMAERICREDGCINFFAGPAVKELSGSINLYRIHYDGIHVVGTAGSIPEDTVDTIRLIENKVIESGALVSHILGLKAVEAAIYAMEKPSGAKKVCYPHIDIPLIAIDELEELGKSDPLYRELGDAVKKNGGNWCAEAERILLEKGPKLI
ncbi:MAG: L-sorbose 1-phosphate reductase [Ruminococcaceae bacterium]|nr:L-sorbose 1-phosphate reductase [Oscillospiraceae bacterium]